MKLSEMTTEHGLDVLCEITPHVKAISSDKVIKDKLLSLAKLGQRKGITKAQLMTEAMDELGDLVPVILKDHRSDIYSVLCAVNDMDVEQIKAQTFPTTVAQIMDLIKDKDLMQVFT